MKKKAGLNRIKLLLVFLVCFLMLFETPRFAKAETTVSSAAPVIAMFGDSITKGVDGTGTIVSANIPYFLSKYLGVTCKNFGVSSMGWLRQVPGTGLRAYDKISTTNLSPYNTFILCFGVNDDKSKSLTLGAANSTSETTVVGQMRKCIKYIQKKKPGSTIIIVAPFMSAGNDRSIMRATFKKVAASLNLPFIDQNDSPFNLSTIEKGSYDGIHPNAASYKKLGGWLSAKVRKILGVKPIISSATIPFDSSYPYTGAAITPKPVVTVKVDGVTTTLIRGTDYSVSYKNNISPGTATMTITGKGKYAGSASETFKISKVPLGSATLEHTGFTYAAAPRTQTYCSTVTATVNGKKTTLKYNRDYTITYKDNLNVGTATMIFKGIGNFRGSITKTFVIRKAPLESVTIKYPTLKYTGARRTQTGTTVVRGTVHGTSMVLKYGTDYTITYKNVREIGTATMIVTGIGNFKGTIEKTYNITK